MPFSGEKREARAAREVIVSAGAIASPQLLELSGIGQAERLKKLGIKVHHDLPGVGENLRDHWAPRMKWRVGRHGVTFNERARGLARPVAGTPLHCRRTGFLSQPASPLRAFFKTREGLDSPDAMLTVQPFLVTPNLKLAKQAGNDHHHPPAAPREQGQHPRRSRPMPRKPPAIRFNFLAERSDRDCVLACMRTVRAWSRPRRWRGSAPRSSSPARRCKSDDELLDFVTRTAETTYHPVGTCRMGSDPAAVVDDRLRVHGIAGLARRRRVDHADADLRQHQCAVDHDRREGRAHGAGSRGLIAARGVACRRCGVVVVATPLRLGASLCIRVRGSHTGAKSGRRHGDRARLLVVWLSGIDGGAHA